MRRFRALCGRVDLRGHVDLRGALALLLLLASLVGTTAAWASVPTGSLTHGPFEITALARRVSAGGFPNQGGNPFATREVSDFEVRWRGQRVSLAGGSTRFWRVLRLGGAPRPTLLLVTTGFVLATEDDVGKLQLTALQAESSSVAEAQWLDSQAGQPGQSMKYSISAIRDIDADTRFEGGRWLRLGSRVVIDVSRLAVFAVSPWVPHRPGVPITSISRDSDTVRAFSPGRSQYVLAASGNDYESGSGRQRYGLLVVDIASGIAHELRVERQRLRFADLSDIDAAWIDHHFVWQRDATGGERLSVRQNFLPWPWRARLNELRPGEFQIELPRIDAAFVTVLRSLIIAQFGASTPVTLRASGPGLNAEIGECRLSAAVFGVDRPDPGELRLSIWQDSTGGTRAAAGCAEVLPTLTQAINRELASGRHDSLLKLE